MTRAERRRRAARAYTRAVRRCQEWPFAKRPENEAATSKGLYHVTQSAAAYARELP